MDDVTWMIRCKLKTSPDTWTVLGENRREPLPALMTEVEQAMMSPFGAAVVPGTMELRSSDGQHLGFGMLTVPAEAVPTMDGFVQFLNEKLGGLLADGKVPPNFIAKIMKPLPKAPDPFAGMNLPPFPGIDAASLN